MSGSGRDVAVVTGAAQGIGRAIAMRLARDGFEVVAVDRDAAAVEHMGQEIGGRAYVLDVSDPDAVAALAGRLGPCRVLVNNAGIWRYALLSETTPQQAHDVLATNLLGPLLLMQALVPLMAGGGSVVNISSVVAHSPPGGVGLYPPSKAALETLTRMAAAEFGPAGVRCNAVAPGLVPTEGTQAHFGDESARAGRGALLPLGRLGTPEDIAGVVSFLCSDDARYVTGQVIRVDGGYTAAVGGGSRAKPAG
jgi:3-oxoacyl-[acyl-carrier protein] reductase